MFSAVTVVLCLTQLASGAKLAVATPASVPAPAAAVASTAPATGAKLAEGNFDYDIADFNILQNKEVQKELGVTEALRATLNKHAEWFNGEMKVLDTAFKKARENDPKATPPNDKAVALQKEFKKRLFAELTTAQVVRLREITVQGAGDVAVLDKRVASKIGLTNAQITAIKGRFEDNSKKAQAFQQDLNKQGGELQQKYLKPLIEKYGNSQPKDQADATSRQAEVKAALEPHKSEFQALQSKLEGKMKELEGDFKSFLAKTLDDKEKKALQDLKGKTFKTS